MQCRLRWPTILRAVLATVGALVRSEPRTGHRQRFPRCVRSCHRRRLETLLRGLRGTSHSPNGGRQLRKIAVHNAPNRIEVDPQVRVHEHVAESRYGLPRNVSLRRLDCRGQALCRLGQRLQIPYHSRGPVSQRLRLLQDPLAKGRM